MVSIILTLSSRATMAAGTRPPRLKQTIASHGPASCRRQARARESRWNWSHETGKIFSGRGGFFSATELTICGPHTIRPCLPREHWIPASAGITGVRGCPSRTLPFVPAEAGTRGAFSKLEMSSVFDSISILARDPQLQLDLRKHCLDLRLHRGKLLRIARSDHNIGIRPLFFVDEWIAANDRFRMRLGDRSEFGTDIAFLRVGPDCFRQQLGAGFELRRDLIEHRVHHGRNPGHGNHVADPEAGCTRYFVRNKLGSTRNARHAQARLVQFTTGLGETLLDDRYRVRMEFQ